MAKFLLCLLAIFLPFVAVFIVAVDKSDFALSFTLNIILCIFLWIPAVLHAWYVIVRS